MVDPRWRTVRDARELRDLVGEPAERAVRKVRPTLHDLDRQWLAASPFCLLATSAADGSCDVSPKGDPAGRLAHVIDDRTIALAERPGNRRVDGYLNVVDNPHVGLLFVIPGRDDTLRINGRATLVRDAPFFDELVVKGHRPILALVVEIDEVFHHCAKAFLRSQLWSPETWKDELPSTAVLAKTLVAPDAPMAELEEYYGESYGDRLYRA
ncbi:pyridoxamine 5'-phosphate oxidase family protein [Nakamurella flavida]|uniref:Pyridoxamine 5'-phosphate oxidase family protein n=1 Tax=Nakamurella flavida TaxID=363630 RepID=A0A938YMN7_9ACTN|nr:pyridoxamine 5'-phosphate oxidase family protein [Nakamurella flavida]MBM9477513.1 pyridoxamine 5'-phosphate oxidase family protein [Nakamurella flavida]MDP9777446.1 PPOX class probable FMN-dependent enzyme [Nakamurella flavida]